MKKQLLPAFLFALAPSIPLAPVGISSTVPDPDAHLDVQSTSPEFLTHCITGTASLSTPDAVIPVDLPGRTAGFYH